MTQPRYIVKKNSGSYQAKVIDTATGKVIKSYDVRRSGGWHMADTHCDALNALDKAEPEGK